MSSTSRSISVVIPTYNNSSTLISCLTSIYHQTFKPREILVVDNGSTSNLTNIRTKFPKVRVIRFKNNTGVTGGRNAGIERVNKKINYILFFDHDMVADKNMIKNLVKAAEEDSSFGILTPKIFYWGDKKRIWAAGTNINLWTGQILFRGGQDTGQFEKIEEVQVAPAAILIKKNVMDMLKKFDDRYYATYEDTDFCFRAKDLGFKTVYSPLAIAYHNIETSKESERKRLLSRSYFVARNRIFFMKRFSRSFLIFLLFSPVYLLYFSLMSLRNKNLEGLINFIKGYYDGLKD